MKSKKAFFFVAAFGILVLAAAPAWATVSMNNASVSSGGSGNAMGTATITSEGPWDVQEPGYGAAATVTPSGTAISFQQAHAIAWDGTANASTSGTIVEVGSGAGAGDTVVATTAGSTSATAQKVNDPVRAALYNEATSRLLAAGGAGTVASNFFNTSTGFMTVDSSVHADSTGSEDATAGTDASGSSKGSASVAYTFAGQGSAETLSLANANVAATADVDGDTTVVDPSFAHGQANAGGVVGWTNTPTEGQALGAFLNLDSETSADRPGGQTDNGLPAATADAAGTLNLNYVLRANPPYPGTVFSFVGNVNGSTDSEAEVTQGNGIVESQGIKAAVGMSGTGADAPTGVMAWIAGNVRMEAYAPNGDTDLFDGEGEGHAVNPAVLGESDVTPDPAMAITTQLGTYSAAMGSGSLVNAEVTATGVADEFEDGDTLVASAFAFATSMSADTDTAAVPGVELYDLAGPYAFVGQGSIAATNTGDDGVENATAASASVLNMFGTASSPAYTAALNNGDSAASVAQDDDYVFQRAASAGADSVSGTNYPVAIAHNQMNGTFTSDANSPWFDIFFETEPQAGAFDHLATGFIGGGGD